MNKTEAIEIIKDKAGTGSNELFTSKHDAIAYAKDSWNRLNESDQQSYIDDPCGEFMVTLTELEWDDASEEFVPSSDPIATAWTAF